MTKEDPLRLVLVTAPDEGVARDIAAALVTEGLVACANLVPGIRSLYFWKGRVEEDAEVQLLLKTRAGRLEALERRVAALHPFEVPEFVVLPIEAASPAYASWLREVTTETRPE